MSRLPFSPGVVPMNRFLSALAVAAFVGVWAVPAPAADPKKPEAVKPLEGQIFDKLLEKHKDLTFEELKSKAIKPREYPAGFVSIDQNRRHSFASAYFQIYSADLPVLVTTDSIMHALHKSYDDILMEM